MVVSSLLLLLLLPAVLGLRLPSGRILAPRTDDGYTSQVSWDGYSFSIQTPSQDTPQRVFIQSGEMHTWRLPVPTLWRDIVQKAKAAGLNCISIYFHWALTNPKEGVVDMEGINDIQPLFDYAKEAGLWVIARPGPYINAETSGGGIPGWVTTLPGDPEWNPYNGELRSNDTYFHDAWQQYIRASAQLIAKNQITEGGPIILAQVENEFYNGAGQNEYVSELQDVYRDEGIVVPTMVNDAGMYKNIVNEANIYGIDAYPNGALASGDLSWPTAAAGWEKGPAAWRTYHENVMPDTPFMFPEFQGGQYDKWGSGVGYARCREVIGPEYERVLYHQLWASGVTAENFYMFYGGTNWGQLAYPATYTSYDVGAAITESRELTTKYSELKLQSLFLRSTPDLYKTDFVSNDSSTLTSNERVMATWLKNPDTGASFYITRQANVSWSDVESYKLTTEDFTLPQLGGELTLNGKDSRIIVKDLSVGAASLLYSTAHIMTSTVVDETDVLVIYADVGETVELAFDISEIITVDATLDVKSNISTTTAIVNFQMTTGITPIRLSGDGTSIILVVAADYPTATTFWQPTIAGDDDFAAYVHIGANTPVLVVGPYLVRTATLEDNDSTLVLTGDLNATTTLTVIAPDAIQALTWNGEPVSATRNDWGALTATLPGPELTPQIPDLTSLTWKYTDSLPEIQPGYDDSQWTPANHTETTSKFPQFYGGPWKLGVASDYGYHVGNLLWRGHFDYNGQAAVNLSISGGFNFAAAAWVNDVYLGATEGGASSTRNVSWAFPEGSLTEGDNVITVLQDHMGFNLAGQVVCCSPGGRQRDIQSPRGIEGYYLLGSDSSSVDQFTSWKVQGNFGGEDHPDKTRRIFNEGGLFGERMGYHLPGYDDSDWETKSPWDGIDKPGVAWYRTTFDLELPEGHDIPMSFVFSNDTGFYRAQLYVNGWQMGKRVANLGPQTAFPVHEGILNYRGSNTLALSLWSLGSAPEDLSIPSLMLQPSGTYSGGVGGVEVNNPGWEDRQAW